MFILVGSLEIIPLQNISLKLLVEFTFKTGYEIVNEELAGPLIDIWPKLLHIILPLLDPLN